MNTNLFSLLTGVSGVCSLTEAWNITADTNSELKFKKKDTNDNNKRLCYYTHYYYQSSRYFNLSKMLISLDHRGNSNEHLIQWKHHTVV